MARPCPRCERWRATSAWPSASGFRQFFQIRELVGAGADVSVLTVASPQSHAYLEGLARASRIRRRRFTGSLVPNPAIVAIRSSFDRLVIAHAESFDLLRGAQGTLEIP
jgi:hypothetical protein